MLFRLSILTVCMLVAGFSTAFADAIYLTNGDRITGEITNRGGDKVTIKSLLIGDMVIDRQVIDRMLTEEEYAAQGKSEAQAIKEEEAKRAAANANQEAKEAEAAAAAAAAQAKPKYWSTKLNAGYGATNGNSKTSHLNVGVESQYKRDENEWNLKGNLEYGSDKGKMNTQKAYGKAQSNTRMGTEKKWFNSRTFEVTHDYFSNIDYRVLPSFGFGYWFFEGDNSKFELDLGLGYEYTNYRDSTKPSGNFTLIPHLFYDKVLIGKLKFAQDLTFYPSLESLEDYRFRSESSLVNPISEKLNWKLSFIDEYNASPMSTAKKNDTSLITAIEYAF